LYFTIYTHLFEVFEAFFGKKLPLSAGKVYDPTILMKQEFNRYYVPESYIKSPDGKRKFSPTSTQFGVDRDTLLVAVEAINAGSIMFEAQEQGDKEAQVLFHVLNVWSQTHPDVYAACQQKVVNLTHTPYFQSHYPEYLFFLAQEGKLYPYEMITFSVDDTNQRIGSLRQVDLLKLVLSYGLGFKGDKRVIFGI